jgi:DNA-directed RNA polymerase subunit RPC12/RpoP
MHHLLYGFPGGFLGLADEGRTQPTCGGRPEETVLASVLMAIPVQCSACGTEFHAADRQAGKRVRCPACAHRLTVPRTPPASAQSADEPDLGQLARLEAAAPTVLGAPLPRVEKKERASTIRSMAGVASPLLVGKWILTLIILFGPAVLLCRALPASTVLSLKGLGIWSAYVGVWVVLLLIAEYVEFCTDTDDLGWGWCGGWVDDPLSWSDNINRLLLSCRRFFAIPEFVLKTFSDTLSAMKK